MYLHTHTKIRNIKEAKLFHIHDHVLKSLVFKKGEKKKSLSHCESASFKDSPAHTCQCAQCMWYVPCKLTPPHPPITQTYTDFWNRMYKSLCLALNSAGPQHKQLRLLFLALRLLLHGSQVQHYITDGATTHPKKKKEEPEQRLQKEEEMHTYRIQRFLPLSFSLSHTQRERKKTWLNPGHLSVLPFGDEGGRFGR